MNSARDKFQMQSCAEARLVPWCQVPMATKLSGHIQLHLKPAFLHRFREGGPERISKGTKM